MQDDYDDDDDAQVISCFVCIFDTVSILNLVTIATTRCLSLPVVPYAIEPIVGRKSVVLFCNNIDKILERKKTLCLLGCVWLSASSSHTTSAFV